MSARRVVVAAIVATTTLLAACSGDGSNAGSAASDAGVAGAPAPDAVAVERPGPAFPEDWEPPVLDWEQCGLPTPGRCATLAVPLDWADPDGATIDIRVGRVPAAGDAIGPLAINPGGPGGSGLEFLAALPVSGELSDRFDLVSWDPRGVGESAALACGSTVEEFLVLDPDPDDSAEAAELDAAADAVAQECARSDAEVLGHVHTATAANDLEAIRRALGGAPMNYLGFSYGTKIGQEYLARFPQHVRAMALDGVADPSQGFEEFHLAQAAAFERAFDVAADACAQAGTSRCGVANLADAYDRVALRLDEDVMTSSNGDDVTPATLATAAILTTYGSDGWRQLGPALASALDGDGDDLWFLASQYHDLGGYTSYAAVVCTDSAPPRGDAYAEFAERAREIAPRFGGSVANEMLPCATWPAEAVGLDGEIRVPGAPPVLVIGNTGDAATPIENAEAVAEMLESATLITVESDGHTAYGSVRCVTDIVDRYFVELVVPERDVRC